MSRNSGRPLISPKPGSTSKPSWFFAATQTVRFTGLKAIADGNEFAQNNLFSGHKEGTLKLLVSLRETGDILQQRVEGFSVLLFLDRLELRQL